MSNKKNLIIDHLGSLPIEPANNHYQSGLPWHQSTILGVVKPKTRDDIGLVLRDAHEKISKFILCLVAIIGVMVPIVQF